MRDGPCWRGAGDRFAYRPKRVAADTAYGSAAFLAFVTDRGTIPHIPVLERSEQTKGKFPREAFGTVEKGLTPRPDRLDWDG